MFDQNSYPKQQKYRPIMGGKLISFFLNNHCLIDNDMTLNLVDKCYIYVQKKKQIFLIRFVPHRRRMN